MNDMSRKRLEKALGPDFEVVKSLLAIRRENRSTYLKSQIDVNILWFMQVLLGAIKAGTEDYETAWEGATQLQLEMVNRLLHMDVDEVQDTMSLMSMEDYIIVALTALEAL